MKLSRREALMLAAGGAALTFLPASAYAAVDEAIAALTGGAEMSDAGITLIAPEIAENGNTVPIEVDAPGAVEITLFAAGNPTPAVASVAFGPLAAAQSAATRVRLAGTQDVIAIAKMSDGSFAKASSEVKVTIGGCGG